MAKAGGDMMVAESVSRVSRGGKPMETFVSAGKSDRRRVICAHTCVRLACRAGVIILYICKVGADFGGVGVDSPHGRAPLRSQGVHN